MPIRARSKRRRQRGAAMVEAAAIAVAMMVVFACMWAALSYEATKIRVMDEARQAAWVAAIKPCEGAGSTLGDLGKSVDDADADPMPSTKSVDKYIDLGTTSLATDSGYVKVSRARLVTFPKMIGGATYEMRSNMHMRCNEPEPPENALDFFKTAFSVVKYTYAF